MSSKQPSVMVFDALESRLLLSSTVSELGDASPMPCTATGTTVIELTLDPPTRETGSPAPIGPFKSVDFIPLMQGTKHPSLVTPPNVARSADEIPALGIDASRLPAVDFDKYMLVVVTAPGGYAFWNTVRVEGVVQASNGLYVYRTVEKCPESAHIPELPDVVLYAVIAVPKSDGPVYSLGTGLRNTPVFGPREMRGIEARSGPNHRVRAITRMDADGIPTVSGLVSLDGRHSRARGAEIINYTWTLNGEQIAAGAKSNVVLPVGLHEITLTVIDSRGRISTDRVKVRVLPLV